VLIGKDAIDMSDIKSISEPGPEEKQSVPGIPSEMALGGHPIPVPPELGGATAAGSPAAMPAAFNPSSASPIPSAQNMTPLPQVAKHEKPIVKPQTKENSLKRAKLEQGSITDAQMPGSLYKQLLKQGVGEG
jgi:hypothetical protein